MPWLDFKPVTTYELISTLVSILGFFAVIVSLLYLAKQTRESTQQTKLLTDAIGDSPYATLGTQIASINQVLVDHPEARPYFYGDAPLPEQEPLRSLVLAVGETFLDMMDSVLDHRVRLEEVYGEAWWACWGSYIGDVFSNSHVLCEQLEDSASWYSVELYDLMQSRRATPLVER